MTSFTRRAALLAAGLVLSTGCGTPPAPTPPDTKPEKPAHSHPTTGPVRGGAIGEWGEEDYHLEVVPDRAAGTITAYVLDGTVTKVTAVSAKTLTLSLTATPPVTIPLEPKPQDGDEAGRSSRFVGTHDALKKPDLFSGSVSGEVDGKKYTGEFREKPAKK